MISNVIKEDVRNILLELEEELKDLSGKKILITGGNGFIASYLVDLFVELSEKLKNPIKIYVINRNKLNPKSRLSHLIGNKNILFMEQDIGKPLNLPKGINIIFHAASNASPISFMKNPLETIDSNINGTRNLLEYSKENHIENFLLFSSVDVYGNPPKEFLPTSELYNGNVDPTNPRSCYSESKRFSETLCSVFFRNFKVPAKILRIGHTYGPGLREDKAINEFFRKSINSKKIDLRDSGEAKLSYCYISDVIRGILKVMFKGNSGEAYNIGSGFPPVSIKDLALSIGNVQSNGTIVAPIYSEGNSSKGYIRYPDITKLKGLGFKPKINLEEGLLRIKSHYEETGTL
ncbi:MAG: NAD-dependent epimerase/dehydratase family protein [archaeon]|nr:NAD-dependent epimerase/dehydratase family protein [archaeon]